MSRSLLAISIGPVQDMIAAARRTPDLWFGSFLLSEISKAAARSLQEFGATLIFPNPNPNLSHSQDLEPLSEFNVANLILAECDDPKAASEAAKKATLACWLQFANEVLDALKSHINLELWNEQSEDIFDFYAAWLPYRAEAYCEDRRQLMELLQARKRCRDFKEAKGHAGIPKSSLDGLRESVLIPCGERPESFRKLRLQEGEQLDVLGLVKRAWLQIRLDQIKKLNRSKEDSWSKMGNLSRYPSVSRIAADPWVRNLSKQDLNLLRLHCEELDKELNIRRGASAGLAQYNLFPFEGTLLFRSRHASLLKETGCDPACLQGFNKFLSELYKKYGEPYPYFALLIADGDRIGAALSKIESPEEHRQFSADLATFAGKARSTVENYQGSLIYAGGDDVMALVPLDQCLACAHDLSQDFCKTLSAWSTFDGKKLSLSVGLAIGHFMEPFEDLLSYGRAAENHAKNQNPGSKSSKDRNALAIHILKRGGEPIRYRANWTSDVPNEAGPETQLMEFAHWIADDALSNRIAHELHQIAALYQSWPGGNPTDAIQRDACARLSGKFLTDNVIGALRSRIQNHISDAEGLRALANQLLVAQLLAPALKKAKQEQV